MRVFKGTDGKLYRVTEFKPVDRTELVNNIAVAEKEMEHWKACLREYDEVNPPAQEPPVQPMTPPAAQGSIGVTPEYAKTVGQMPTIQ